MTTKSRIESILQTACLDSSVTGFPTFKLNNLEIKKIIPFELTTTIRLGHLVEKIVSELINSSSKHQIIAENIQLIIDKTTIGEIDYIIQDIYSNQFTHMELAYKFYLYDPTISSSIKNNWIGPNRNDSMVEKLAKLKAKQFPLLYHDCVKDKFKDIKIKDVNQELCFLVSLYIPYQYKETFSPVYQKAIKGYYIDYKTFMSLNNPGISYYLPTKKEWGMNPAENKNWGAYNSIENELITYLRENKAPLCWQKEQGVYSSFFIIWW